MRLINTTTLQFEEFVGTAKPPYAILSHRWSEQEVTFDEFQKTGYVRESRNDGLGNELQETFGYRKIRSFCEIARARCLQYAWADTCCINKSSSAELTEAINSMGAWYAQADVCIVYLADVSSLAGNYGNRDVFQEFEESAWFTRGWTLQELLMPRRLIFYSGSWERIGSLDKDNALISQPCTAPTNLSPPRRGFLTSLERASRIKIDDLCITDQYQSASVAQRMFWASHRCTSREEDKSYSLLNLFNVNMPLVYGEGSRSFVRLQKEIMERSSDESVFAWTLPPSARAERHPRERFRDRNVFAASPADFYNSNDIERTPVNLDRAIILNSNGIDIYRESNNLCVFRRQRELRNEQLLFVIQLGCERSVPGQPSDPCVIALLAEIRRGSSASHASVDDFVRSPITIQRRIMGQTLSALSMSRLSDLGFESVEALRQDRYHFWLPFENILPSGKETRDLTEWRPSSRL